MKKIAILGAGESGVGAAILAKLKGYGEVFVSDFSTIAPKYRAMLMQHNITWEEGRHSEDIILRATEVVKSPGIPDYAPIIKKIKQKNIPVISEIEFAGRYTSAKMICITGSNGKTTTTMLTYHILKSAGLNVGLAGNVGHSLAYQVATKHFDYYVLELSSFQLECMYDFRADIAILLNITPDHLDRYAYDFQAYIDAKFRIIQNQTQKDAFIYWNDDPVIQAELAKRTIQSAKFPFALHKENGVKAFVENLELIILSLKDEPAIDENQFSMPVEELSLDGIHNTYNSMAAGLSAKIMDLHNNKIREALSDFKGVEHRLEYVATVRGVRFVNDSKATNVNSCWYALQSMKTPTVLILGGTDKGNDYTEIENLVKEKVKALVFLGVDNEKLKTFFCDKVETIAEAKSMQEAVEKAFSFSEKNDTVLLSPCCASFDLFRNYEDRGEQFKKTVKQL